MPRPPQTSPPPSDVAEILCGGGEMGALARATDWSRTPVGDVHEWPQSLRTAVSILLESKFPMLLCWGPEYVQFYNDRFRPILGLSKHPALGRTTTETFAEAWHIIGPLFEQVRAGQAVGFDDMLVPLDRNGFLEECYFVYSYSPIRDESRRVGGVLVTCTETTARVIAERRLRTLRELASEAAQAQDEPTAWAGASQVLRTNAADLPFALVYSLDDHQRTARLVSSDPPPWAPAAISSADDDAPWPLFAENGSTQPQVVEDLQRRIGAQRGANWPEVVHTAMVLPLTRRGVSRPYGFLVAGISPRLALDDKYRDFLMLVADQIATAIANARAYQEERRRIDALEEIDRQKTNFFNNVSHEFRTPLTLLLAPLQDALRRSPPALGPAELDLVHRNAMRLLRLVNTLLDFSRLESGQADPMFESTDLAALTREIASTFQSLMDEAGIAFNVECPPLDRAVAVDVTMWEKIVLNLLSNAFKFTEQGSVSVSLASTDDMIHLRVSDTGVGIPPAHVVRVFERFHRVEGMSSRSFEGSGIGLALVRELARMHGGDVAADSVEGRGTTFTVSIPATLTASAGPEHLPLGRAASIARPFLEDARRRWDAESVPQRAASEPHGRILVVDDNADMRDYLRRLFEEGFDVEFASNGRLALEAIAAHPPDLVLTDLMMPEVGGMELLRRLRASESTRGIPVIMLSARAGEESRLDGLNAGAEDYIVKPFSSRELVARVRLQLEVSRLRRETAAQNDRLFTLINVAPAAIAVLSGPRHVYELANELYFRIVGRRDLIGRPGREALPELVEQRVWDLFDRVYTTGHPYVAQESRIQLDRLGTGVLDEGFFNFVLQPLKNARGHTHGILIHAIEVTEQVVARRAVEDARLAAEAANRAKDEFIAMLGHELRNPLAPILTALQLMSLRGDVGAERERDVIERQVRHVVRLVDDLLDVSRIARGKIELKRTRVEMFDVVAKAIETTSPLIEQKNHTLVVEVPQTGLAVDGDGTRLQQIVFNLLSNATKYTERRGQIEVRARRNGNNVELSVRDSGIGIDAAMLPHVFDLFTQDRQALDRSDGGLGLGLAIVRNLAELHGGRVTVSSEGRGRGTEFVVSLPAAATPATARPVVHAERERPLAPNVGVRVLVVDDNEDAAEFLATALSLEGFETRVANDGPAALKIVETFRPHVALLDLGLPVMDGYELATHLRALPDAPTLIALTGYGAEKDRRRSRACGFAMHLVKPVDVDQVVQLLRTSPA